MRRILNRNHICRKWRVVVRYWEDLFTIRLVSSVGQRKKVPSPYEEPIPRLSDSTLVQGQGNILVLLFFFFVVVVFLFVFLFSLEIFQIKGLCCAVTDVRWIKRRELLNGAIVAVERKSEGGLGMSFFFFLLLSICHTWVNVELRFTNWTGAWNKLRSPLPLPRNWISVVVSNPRDFLKRIFVSKCGCHNICFSKWITRSFVCTYESYESSRQLYTQLKEHSSPEALKQSHSVNSNFRPVFNIPGSQSPDYLTRYVSIEG